MEGGGLCNSTPLHTGSDVISKWAAQADLIYWIKRAIATNNRLSTVCSCCKALRRTEGEAKMKEIFVEFCKILQIQYPGEKKRKRDE